MKIAVLSSSERSVPNVVKELSPGHFTVTYTPTEPALHRINVTFSGVHVPGTLKIQNEICECLSVC